MTQFSGTSSGARPHSGSGHRGKTDALIVVSLFLSVSLLQGILAFHWFALGVFDQFNVMFDTDPNTWLRYGSSTRPDVGTSKHPLAAYYAGIPVLVLSKLAGGLPGAGDPAALRVMLALCIAPLVTGAKQCFVYLTVRKLGLTTGEALIITGLSAFSFSSVVFGAVPETYGYTGLFTAIGFYCVASPMSSHPRSGLAGLIVTCFFSIGASTANLVAAGWLFWMRSVVHNGYTLWGFVRAGVLAGCVGIATLSTFWGFGTLRGVSLSPATVFLPNTHDIDTYSPDISRQAYNFLRFPERLAQSLVATMPVRKHNILAQKEDLYQFELSYNPRPVQVPALIQAALGTVVLLAGALGLARAQKSWRHIAILSFAFIGSYAVIFSFYGHNTFLYSQHWQVPAVFLLATTLRTRTFDPRWSHAALSLALCGFVICLALTLAGLNDLLLTATTTL